mgnify:CR=1 FL=1
MNETDKIDFNTNAVLLDYYTCMSENFMLIRIMLPDEVDAILMHYLDNRSMTLRDLHKVEEGLSQAIEKLVTRYPGKVPRAANDQLRLPAVFSYEVEENNCLVVFNLTHILVHMKATTSSIIKSVNKNIK